MTPSKMYLAFILLLMQTCSIYAGDVLKGSLTFVIDDTGSMGDEIRQVKESVSYIFDTVTKNEKSQIENFVLVTFNDPGVQERIVTKDRNAFKSALASINVHNGGDCPEYAMSGIKLGLQKSLPHSLFYVYTDASAADYHMLEEVRSVASKKQIQVSFLLTGECGSRLNPDYKAFYNLANDTGGDVYNMMKRDISDIMKAVAMRITGRDELLAGGKFGPGYDHEVPYTVDAATGDLTLSIGGRDPELKVKDHENKTVATTDILRKPEIMIAGIKNPKPGNYTAIVGSSTDTLATIRAKTKITIEARFSGFKPASLNDTAAAPAPEGETFLSIQTYGEGVKFEKVSITDTSGNEVAKLTLHLPKDPKTNRFYLGEFFNPPKSFRVVVIGYSEEDKSEVKREVKIDRQTLAFERPIDVAPTVTIEGAPNLEADYGAKVQLKCHIHAYPEPKVIWQEKETGIIFPAKVSIQNVPYDYISILTTEKMTKNSTYECQVSNRLGVSVNSINIRLHTYFNVIQTPEDIHIEYGKKATLVCNIDASPPASISWYKDGTLLTNDTVEISSNMTTMTIPYVVIESQGNYMCEARNDLKRELYRSNIDVYGLKPPVINKTSEVINVLKGGSTEIWCRISEGVPPPTIKWYFQGKGHPAFEEIDTGVESLYLSNVADSDIGTYKCIASNLKGSDVHAVDLVINYPPIIKDDNGQFKNAIAGHELFIPCDVDGIPNPEVTWSKDGHILDDTVDSHKTANSSFRIKKISVPDAGLYICKAVNEHGSAEKKVQVNVLIPPHIYPPTTTKISTEVDKDLSLACHAYADPKPEIKWVYNKFHKSWDPRTISESLKSSLYLRRLQTNDEGFYMCIATNAAGSSNLTFVVEVNAKPVMEVIYPTSTHQAVNGDLALNIQCRATGRPKPTIAWKKDDLYIAAGTEWYDIEDGTLIIKNIDAAAAGIYSCIAENKLGEDSVVHNVIVQDYPIPSFRDNITRAFLENGKTGSLTCNVPHGPLDLLRWYKNGALLSETELTLDRVTPTNEGLYSCRVSNMTTSTSAHVNVTVGEKPFFVDDDIITNITFVRGDIITLDCYTYGEPEPEVTWKYNNKTIPNEKDNDYEIAMELENIGTYTCEVKNGLGSIERSFTITPTECILDTRKDFLRANQPAMTNGSTWVQHNLMDQYMVINNDDQFYLNCQKGFSNFPGTNVYAFCAGGSNVKIYGNSYKYSEIKCNEETDLTVVNTGKKCSRGNAEIIQIGYTIFSNFLKVYEVCLDKTGNVPLYTQHALSSSHYNASINTIEWTEHSLLPFEFDSIYNCNNQANTISSTPGTVFHLDGSCCFGKRQLVNPKDLRPGIPSAVAYTYLNVVPHWSTCNSQNWAAVEESVRNLAKSFRNPLTIFTGTANFNRNRESSLRAGGRPSLVNLKLYDDRGKTQPVSPYLWKIVQDPETTRGVVIVQVNVPELNDIDAPSYVLCKDVCDEVKWLKGIDFHNVEKGYTFCCSVLDFERRFHFYKQFSTGRSLLLKDVFYSPKYY